MQSSGPSEAGDLSANDEFHEPTQDELTRSTLTASVAWTASITNVTTINLGTTISM